MEFYENSSIFENMSKEIPEIHSKVCQLLDTVAAACKIKSNEINEIFIIPRLW